MPSAAGGLPPLPDSYLRSQDFMRSSNVSITAALESSTKSPQRDHFLEAIHALELANQQGSPCSHKLYSPLLQWSIDWRIARLGRELHCSIVKRKAECDAILATYIIRMYAACSNLDDADKVFNSLSNPDVYMWSAIILAHTNAGQGSKAIELYRSMLQRQGLRPDAHMFVAVLKACAATAASREGKLVHAHTIESSVELVLHVGNTLIDMYVRCGCLEDAHMVFEKMPKRDVVTWNVLIAGYSCNGHDDKAFELCQKMQEESIVPDNVTFLSLVGAANARSIGNFCCENHEPDSISQKLEYALMLFNKLPNRSLAAWSAMIGMYSEHGDQAKAFCLYLDLLQRGLKPDIVTFVCALKACSDLDMAKCIHFHIIESGYQLDRQIQNCLIATYGQCGSLEDARMLFDAMHNRCVVTWSSMISAYAQYGRDQESLELFGRMLHGGVKPNHVTYFYAMRSCTNMTALILSLLVYAHVVDTGWDSHMQVKNTAIDMFAKCGSLADACSVFQGMPQRSVVTWSTIISAYVQHSENELSLECFNGMVQEGIKPNSVTYVCLLSACYHLGLVNQGSHHLYTMQTIYGIKPTPEHRNCLVELFGRAGQLKEAADLLQGMPEESAVVAWTSLLNQCKAHGNAYIAEQCFDSIANDGPKSCVRQVIQCKSMRLINPILLGRIGE
ncbi:hypothetical protein GOP47_0025127 [Adiantum capillus-veneris]|uniref:Pentatricopeptide repeat-containing protein n=1 Tax=Adiantum capillus-veneris TaxID=13818 RepID=A0A9D4U3H0_ADICA|nr:hypothetical protein GOP47_0025127 [Adiantum capillus-veneris]